MRTSLPGGFNLSLVGIDPFIKILRFLKLPKPSTGIERSVIKQFSWNWVEHKHPYLFTGSAKSMQCTKQTHCALTTGSVETDALLCLQCRNYYHSWSYLGCQGRNVIPPLGLFLFDCELRYTVWCHTPWPHILATRSPGHIWVNECVFQRWKKCFYHRT